MNCQKYQAKITVDLDRLVAINEPTDLRQHLQVCRDCRTHWEKENNLLELSMTAMRPLKMDRDLTTSIMNRLKTTATWDDDDEIMSSLSGDRRLGLVALAAGLLVALLAGVLWFNRADESASPLAGESRSPLAREVLPLVPSKPVRILYVENMPRFEYRYLKNMLLRENNIRFQSFLLSADLDFPQESSPGVPPLKEIPATFEELRDNYDVVIIGDVNPRKLSRGNTGWETVCGNIERFVSENGGGVIFIAGTESNPVNFKDTPFEKLVPAISGEWRVSLGMHYKLTVEGETHDITRLASEREVNANVWNDGKIPVYACFATDGAAGGTVLVEGLAESQIIEGQMPPPPTEYPLFTTMTQGNGQVFFSATDEIWRLRHKSSTVSYNRFWGNVVRWVAKRDWEPPSPEGTEKSPEGEK